MTALIRRSMRFALAAIAGLMLCVPAWAGPDVGEQAKLKTVLLDGKPLALEQLKGKVVMVNFWATWCGVCRAEMPGWQKFYEANKGRGFELVAMSIDEDQAELRKHAAKSAGFTFPIAWRWDDATDDNFGDVIGTPTLYILDKNGKVAWTKRGRVTPEQLAAVVEPLLK
jgi:thiol-disulfide isomerase/thioredoxin